MRPLNLLIPQRALGYHALAYELDVSEIKTHSLRKRLSDQLPDLSDSKSIKWSVTKFLIKNGGQVIKRYTPTDKLTDLA